jgi:spore maturation protein CgeB
LKPLRIFYAAHPSLNAVALPNNTLWHRNLFLPLVDLGHDVLPFQYDLTATFQHLDFTVSRDRAFIEENRPRLEAELLRQIEAAHRERPVDVFFSYFYSACARPETIREIRRLGITTVNWYCNAAHQFHLVREIAPAYDYCLVPELERMDDYRRIGANPIYTQEAANPDTYKPYDVPVEYDVVFVGQRYGDRPVFIRALYDAGVNVRAFGPGWLPPPPPSRLRTWSHKIAGLMTPEGRQLAISRLGARFHPRANPAYPGTSAEVYVPPAVCGPAISDAEEVVKMFSRAKISLGLSSCGDTHLSEQRILQIRLRDFEAPMSGAFYMVEYMPELEQFFEIGKEIVCYSDPQDMVDKAKYYLAHDAERERVRRAGRARALRDHTWQKRFWDAFAVMGFN